MSEIPFEPTRPWDDCPHPEDDPDWASPRLRAYHQRLWSHRPLLGVEGGATLVLEPYEYGLIDIGLGRTFFGTDEALFLKSDRVMATWWNWQDAQPLSADESLRQRVLDANPQLDAMGGIIMWPGRMIDGPTLNQARGSSERSRIGDRIDLTLECIRLAYDDDFDHDVNPLGPTLERYWEFFELFGGFRGYVDFWLLNDLVTDDYDRVRFLMHPELTAYDFSERGPLPTCQEEYDTYLANALDFVAKRNDLMAAVWGAADLAEA